jgi:hypothetical protein
MTRKRDERCPNCGGSVFVPAIDNHGKPYTGCPRCVVGPCFRPAFSLRKLLALQRRLGELYCNRTLVPAFTPEEIAIIGFALGTLSAERLAAGERLEDEPEVESEAGQ